VQSVTVLTPYLPALTAIIPCLMYDLSSRNQTSIFWHLHAGSFMLDPDCFTLSSQTRGFVCLSVMLAISLSLLYFLSLIYYVSLLVLEVYTVDRALGLRFKFRTDDRMWTWMENVREIRSMEKGIPWYIVVV